MDASTVPTLIVGLFLVGPLVVVPLGLRLVPTTASNGSDRVLQVARATSLPAGIALAVAFLQEPGPVAGLLAVPWLAMASLAALGGLLDAVAGAGDGRLFRAGPHHAMWAALLFLAVAAGNAMADRIGIQPFGFAPLIVLLTAVHFTFAGFVLVLVGAVIATSRQTRRLELALGALIVGMPVTALGFFGLRPAVLLGAWLVAAGGLGIGLALLRSSGTPAGAPRVLRRIAGLTLLVSMPLAPLYAASDVLAVAWLDIPMMARTHGALNVLGFALPAVVALTLDRRARRATRHSGPAGLLDVVSFNVAPFVLGPVAGLVALFVALTSLPLTLRLLLALGGLLALGLSAGALLTTWWVFGRRAGRRWAWVVDRAGEPRRWLNMTTGFDDSSASLHRSLGGDGHSIDVVDPSLELERPLLRARRRFPPPGAPVMTGAVDAAIEPHGNDVVFLLMAAHEAHGLARADLLRSASRAIAPGGRLILVEHLRDAANILAFGPGAWHFSSRHQWLMATREAGLRLVEETRLSPFVRGFVFVPEADG